MAHDRLQIAARSLAAAQAGFELTLKYARQTRIFGERLVDMQNTQFVLAGVETDLAVGHAFLARLVGKIRDGSFDANGLAPCS